MSNFKYPLSILILCMGNHSIWASTNATIEVRIGQTNVATPKPNISDTKYISDNHNGYAPSSAAASYRLNSDGDSGSASAYATASASAGHLSIYAASSAAYKTTYVAPNGHLWARGGGSGDASASANWYDNMTINAPGLAGKSGSFTANLNISGSVGVNSDPGIRVNNSDGSMMITTNEGNAFVSLAGSGLNWVTQTWDDACGGSHLECANTAYGTGSSTPYVNYHKGTASLNIPVTINFRFGIAQTIGYTMSVNSHALTSVQALDVNGSGGVTALADLSHTFLWGGITGLFDDAGNPLLNFSLNSDSGFDYRNTAVVPLPGTFWLLFSAITGIFSLSRKTIV